MEIVYDLPSGDQVRVVDTPTAARYLSRMLELFREGGSEPLFFGDEPRPQGVVISFEQWAEYEALKEEAEADERVEQVTRDRITGTDRKDYVSFRDLKRRHGWKSGTAEGEDSGSPDSGS